LIPSKDIAMLKANNIFRRK